METKLQALEDTKSWSLVSLPSHRKLKAHLVAKGFTQVKGIDYHETFAPMTKLVTVWVSLAIFVVKNWPLHQVDAQNVFFSW